MGVPNKATKTILLSGVKCNQMDNLLASLYDHGTYSLYEFGSTNSLIDQDDFVLCTVVCENDLDEVTAKAIDKIVECAASEPVIVFGMEEHIDHIVANCGDIQHFTVNDIISLNDLKNVSSSIENCIVFMTEQFACGVDIKFSCPNATVIVLREKPEPRHLIR